MQTEALSVVPTEDVPSGLIPTTNFGVARVKRDILGRSNIGFIGTYRFERTRRRRLEWLVRCRRELHLLPKPKHQHLLCSKLDAGSGRKDESYMGKLNYGGDLIGVDLTYLAVDENFSPEVGFLRREDMRQSYGQFRYSPRPRSIKAIRQFGFEGSFNNFTNSLSLLETRIGRFEFRTEFENGDSFSFEYGRNYEFLDEEFEISDGIFLPIGGYNFNEFEYRYRFGPQRRVSGMANSHPRKLLQWEPKIGHHFVSSRNNPAVQPRATAVSKLGGFTRGLVQRRRCSHYVPITCSRPALLSGP